MAPVSGSTVTMLGFTGAPTCHFLKPFDNNFFTGLEATFHRPHWADAPSHFNLAGFGFVFAVNHQHKAPCLIFLNGGLRNDRLFAVCQYFQQ